MRFANNLLCELLPYDSVILTVENFPINKLSGGK